MPAAPRVRELFIYYLVRPEQVAAALAEVRRTQSRLCETHAGLQARLLRRPAAVGAVQTWMETYTCPALDVESAERWQAQIEEAASGLAPLIEGARHVEVFEPDPDSTASASPPAAQ